MRAGSMLSFVIVCPHHKCPINICGLTEQMMDSVRDTELDPGGTGDTLQLPQPLRGDF